ncbi:MAG: DNA-methyltransferase [bacterium]
MPSLKGSGNEKCGHPSQKPIELIDKLILCSTQPGDLVLDPFIGSGTTAVSAQNFGRKWLGIEINEKYVKIAEKRLEKCISIFTKS